jgi:hypothetical protein
MVAVAVSAVVATVGVGSAAATSLCKENLEMCEGEVMYVGGTKIKAKLVKGTVAKFVTSAGTIECTESALAGESSKLSSEPLPGLANSLSFTGCQLEKTACTITVEHLAYKSSTQPEAGLWNYTLAGFEAPMEQAVVCGTLKCTFSSEAIAFKAVGGKPAKLNGSQVFASKGLLCPKEAKWTAEYEVTEPSPLWFSLKP